MSEVSEFRRSLLSPWALVGPGLGEVLPAALSCNPSVAACGPRSLVGGLVSFLTLLPQLFVFVLLLLLPFLLLPSFLLSCFPSFLPLSLLSFLLFLPSPPAGQVRHSSSQEPRNRKRTRSQRHPVGSPKNELSKNYRNKNVN